MPDSIASDAAQSLFGTLETASSFSKETLVSVVTALLDHLLDGQPVPPETLKETTGRTREEIDRLLTQMEAERGPDGAVVGLGLSLRPTPHQYESAGKIFYGWCAGDTLLFPPILRQTARVTSRDPISGRAVKLTLSPKEIKRIEPTSAVITWVNIGADEGAPSSLRQSLCLPSRFFVRPSTAEQWVADRENTRVHTVEEAYEAARTIAHRIHRMTSSE